MALAASGPDIAKDWKIVVERLASVQWYQEAVYRELLGSFNLRDNVSVVSGRSSTLNHLNNPLNASSSGEEWTSLLLPAGTYIQFPALGPSLSSGSSAAPSSLLIRGSIPDRVALSRDVAAQGWSMDLSANKWSLGSGTFPLCAHVELAFTYLSRCMQSLLFVRRRTMPSNVLYRQPFHSDTIQLPMRQGIYRPDLFSL